MHGVRTGIEAGPFSYESGDIRSIKRTGVEGVVVELGGTRTPDPLLAKQVLSHLSYSPVPCPRRPMAGVAESLQQSVSGPVNETSSGAFLFGTREMG